MSWIKNAFNGIGDAVKTVGNATVDIAKDAGRVIGIGGEEDERTKQSRICKANGGKFGYDPNADVNRCMYGKSRKSNKLRRPKTRASCKKRNMKWQKSTSKRRASCRKKHNDL